MFGNWQKEKATTALIDAAQALADKLASAKPHHVESQAAAAQVWAVRMRAEGQELLDLIDWKPAALGRFVATTQTRIAALRKARDYASSDGLTVWLHTARAVSEPRIAPAVREIWAQLSGAGVNVEAMIEDQLLDAGLPLDLTRRVPKGFDEAGHA
ncbi:MAG: hypothetical protein ACK4GC_12395 [Paracoccaceae bacterium]